MEARHIGRCISERDKLRNVTSYAVLAYSRISSKVCHGKEPLCFGTFFGNKSDEDDSDNDDSNNNKNAESSAALPGLELLTIYNTNLGSDNLQ